MNKKLVLTLLSSPVLFSSMLSLVMTTQAARANQTSNSPGTHVACVQKPHVATPRLVCARVSNIAAVSPASSVVEFAAPQAGQNDNQTAEFNFTEEESDTAVALFGCDCPTCLNAVRQMRGLPPAV